jgi:hypothetical protein
MSSRHCINRPDCFCYMCGEFTVKKDRRAITMKIKQLYKLYFKCEIGDQKRTWAPHIICWRCTKGLHTWIKTGRGLPFAIPMIWREPRDHLTDCYFCAFSINGVHGKSIKRLPYPNIPSAIRPIPHSIELPVPVPPSTPSISSNRSPNSRYSW